MTTSGATRASCFVWRRFCSLLRPLREGGAGVAALLYPPSCVLCGDATPWGYVVCAPCAARLPRADAPLCRQCGETLGDDTLDLCLRCGTRRRGFDRAVSLGPYERGWRELLHAYKFRREKAVGRWLAGELGRALTASAVSFDCVTHVPMTRGERRARGFNPSRLLARGVARRAGVRERRLLAKVRVTRPQRVLTAVERETNLRGAFRAVRCGTGAVLLVDDLLTTGATADECARTLRAAGFERVTVLTVARA